ncbi:MAG: hypothetical protein ACRD63_09130, partial [Pyrinomonadaceae bacterium]
PERRRFYHVMVSSSEYFEWRAENGGALFACHRICAGSFVDIWIACARSYSCRYPCGGMGVR